MRRSNLNCLKRTSWVSIHLTGEANWYERSSMRLQKRRRQHLAPRSKREEGAYMAYPSLLRLSGSPHFSSSQFLRILERRGDMVWL